jgi:hypothetical protein
MNCPKFNEMQNMFKDKGRKAMFEKKFFILQLR